MGPNPFHPAAPEPLFFTSSRSSTEIWRNKRNLLRTALHVCWLQGRPFFVFAADSFVGHLNFQLQTIISSHTARKCLQKKETSPRREGGGGPEEGGFELGCPAALRETSSRPRATLFFSAGFFSLEKKRVQTSKTWFVLGDRGKILRIRLKTERRILSCLICCAATRANRQNRKPYLPSRERSLCASDFPRGDERITPANRTGLRCF